MRISLLALPMIAALVLGTPGDDALAGDAKPGTNATGAGRAAPGTAVGGEDINAPGAGSTAAGAGRPGGTATDPKNGDGAKQKGGLMGIQVNPAKDLY